MENEKSVSGTDSARPWQSYHTAYTNAKAGMEKVDKEKVQRVVYEMSKGSKYFENEEKKEAYMKQKIENMRVQCAKLAVADLNHFQKIADKRIVELEGTRDLSRIWLHVDMDAFYAAVETLCNPSLKGKPMAVGGMSMISTANYEARKFGVRAAMPGFIALKLCPELIFVPTDFKKYTHYSDLTRKVFKKYDPNFLAASLDEAYLDITSICNERSMTAGDVAEELRESIHKETGLTCSAGVAPNHMLAKVCSDINKPNGQFVLPNDRMAVMTFISSLPIRKVGGIGKVTEHVLKDVYEITTCEGMLQKSSFLCGLFSPTTADFFLSVGLGLGRTDTPQATLRKSISNERTFSATKDKALLYKKLVDLAEMLSNDMKKEGLCGRTLTLKLKTSSFEVRTRAVTLPTYTCSSEDILKHSSKLLKAELPASVRLMGLRMSNFNEGQNGGSLDPKQKTLSEFMVTGDASGRELGDQAPSHLNDNDDSLSVDRETSFSIDTWDSIGLQGTHEIPYLHHSDSMLCLKKEEIKRNLDLRIDDLENNVDYHNTVANAINPCPNGASQLVERDSSPGKLEESNQDRGKNAINSGDGEAGSSLNPNRPLLWMNDYKCSLCGAELPPSFLEERQEHFDFHLAERLQEEESSGVNQNPKLEQRLKHKNHIMSQIGQRKKHKTSASQDKYIPIDMFFAKTSQNF
ncbi:DNA polymerase kappa isoform X2 [Olea europaea var. sylvestris]|uniref:DNA polymerase kappa isoform X2 n=1 Tax=Olea europaea var. sylvestris TaxID=158386 RepID=UPI000C1D3829|nr:DNA polymerase kappa isoform X2 [Olea europaea var. sylvestris]